MLSLPLDVLFVVRSRHRLCVSHAYISLHPSDLIGIAAYGPPEPRAYDQDSATGFDVAKVNVGLDLRPTKRWCYRGP